jgi:hypothetical protein
MSATTVEAKSAYEAGRPLDLAVKRYWPPLTSPSPRQFPNILSTHSAGLQMMMKRWDRERREKFMASMQAGAKALDDWGANAAQYETSKARLRDAVVYGKALALGIALGASEPAPIPPHLFKNEKFIDWRKSTVKGDGHEFVSVRVVSLAKFQFAPPPVVRTNPQTEKVSGRPCGKSAVATAYRQLRDKNTEFDFLPKKAAIRLLRERLVHIDGGKFSHISPKTIGKYVADFRRAGNP